MPKSSPPNHAKPAESHSTRSLSRGIQTAYRAHATTWRPQCRPHCHGHIPTASASMCARLKVRSMIKPAVTADSQSISQTWEYAGQRCVNRESFLLKYRREADQRGSPGSCPASFSQAVFPLASQFGRYCLHGHITYQGLEVLYTHQQIADRVAEMGNRLRAI